MGGGGGPLAGAVTRAPDHLLRRYLRGGCFALAHEAARISGLPLMGLRDTDGAVHHAFVADPGTGTSWDIRGALPIARVGDGSAVTTPRITELDEADLLDLLGDPCPYALGAAAAAVRAHLVPAGLPVRPELRVPLGAFRPFSPDPGTAELYTSGGCHLFAIAALDLLSAGATPLGFRVITDPEEPFWESGTDPDDQVPAVVHVYAVLRGPDGEVAVDVLGVRPLAEAVRDCAARFGVRAPGYEDYPNLEGLRDLIEEEGDPDGAERRPLWPISQEGVEGARTAAARLLRAGPSPDPETPAP